MGITPEDIFEMGLVVPDLEKALEELTAVFGVTFTEIMDGKLPMRDAEGVEHLPRFRMAYSRQAPYLEVIEEQPGTPLTRPAGTSLHHLGTWCDDLATDAAALEAKGFPMVLSGIVDGEWPKLWSYHQTSFGTLIELLDRSSKPAVDAIIEAGYKSDELLARVRGAHAADR